VIEVLLDAIAANMHTDAYAQARHEHAEWKARKERAHQMPVRGDVRNMTRTGEVL
jgi:hypothetical protein